MLKKLVCLVTVIFLIINTFACIPVMADSCIAIGDYLSMGIYNGKAILWRCVDIDENGPLMLSDKIITVKPFDAKGSVATGSHGMGYYDSSIASIDRQSLGSNNWSDSNLRNWLNSAASAGYMTWSCSNPPREAYVHNGYNEYADEAGFLKSFTGAERNVMKKVTQKTLLSGFEASSGEANALNPSFHIYNSSVANVLQNYDTAFCTNTTDTVFLPDVRQINAVYKNRSILGKDYYIGEPTAECVAYSEYTSSALAIGKKWHTWLRSPYCADSSSKVRVVISGGSVYYADAYSSNYGVRPAFYLDENARFSFGSGSQDEPYIVHNPNSVSEVKVGEYIRLGTYRGKPILWRCVGVDENGPLMLSDKIICIKPYDAKGTDTSGSHGRGSDDSRQTLGSDNWLDSNLRSWLNSSSTAGSVEWLCSNPPDKDNVSGGYNEYADEAGFLAGFSKTELSFIKPVIQKSLLNNCDRPENSDSQVHIYSNAIGDILQNYDSALAEDTTDTVFVPDVRQINIVYNNSDILGKNYYIGEPTADCIADSEYTSSALAIGKKWHTWLRTPYCTDSSSKVRVVISGGSVYYADAYSSNYGVRPAFYLNTSVSVFDYGIGTATSPYQAERPPADMMNVGDYIRMGTYYGKSVLWRCVAVDENGPLMLSDRILCLKPFDASGTGITGLHNTGYYYDRTQGYYRQKFGSDRWSESNIRTWLNSSALSEQVLWKCGNKPEKGFVRDGYNAYSEESGFLTNFTIDEIRAMKPVLHRSVLNAYENSSGSANIKEENYFTYSFALPDALQNYDSAFCEEVTDTVFLPDINHINSVYENGDILGADYYIGKPTEECIANSEYTDISLSADAGWDTWLSTPYAGSFGHKVRVVDSEGNVFHSSAFNGSNGVRPAFYLNLSSVAYSSGTGTADSPYEISGGSGDGSFNFNVYKMDCNAYGNEIIAKITLDYLSEPVVLYMAVYDSAGRLVCLSQQNTTVGIRDYVIRANAGTGTNRIKLLCIDTGFAKPLGKMYDYGYMEIR